MSTHLKKITARAKQIRKAKPSIKWTDAIKQASKQIGSAPVKKVAGVKKKAAKKVAKRVSKKHTDTKSHNVNIRVVSGIDGMKSLRFLVDEKAKAEREILKCKAQISNRSNSAEIKAHFRGWLAKYRKYLVSLNKQIREAKKFV